VHDLGEQNLKDIQHEHIFELTVDGHSSAYKPLNVAKAENRSEDFAVRFEQRIQNMVERHLERAFAGDGESAQIEAQGLTKMAFSGLGIAFAGLAGLILLIALVVVLVRLVL